MKQNYYLNEFSKNKEHWFAVGQGFNIGALVNGGAVGTINIVLPDIFIITTMHSVLIRQNGANLEMYDHWVNINENNNLPSYAIPQQSGGITSVPIISTFQFYSDGKKRMEEMYYVGRNLSVLYRAVGAIAAGVVFTGMWFKVVPYETKI